MAEPTIQDAYVVADTATARVFSDSAKRRLLLAFVNRPLSVAQAARDAGRPLGRIHYHVTDLCRRGLLRVVREEKRKGRAVKYYQAVRPRFFVPVEFLYRSPGAGLAEELRARLEEEALKLEGEGLLFTAEDGRPRITRIVDGRRKRSSGEYWHIFNMTPADAEALSEELDALLRRYRERTSDKGRPYLFHTAFVPRR